MGDLKSLIILMIAYFITDFLYVYFFSKVLGRKYSLKITLWVTFLMWISDCILKLFPQYLWGIDSTGLVNYIMFSSGVLYVILLYQGKILKKLLASVIYMMIQIEMDIVGMELTIMITGNNDFLNPEITGVTLLCSGMLITLGTVVGVWIWKKFENKSWNVDKYQWLCLIFPFSQYMLIQYTAYRHFSTSNRVLLSGAIGLFIGFAADIYMFLLFDRINARKKAEEEVRQLRHQYELEKLKYEQVKEVQEETAKMRHDFQNYLLALKNIEQ